MTSAARSRPGFDLAGLRSKVDTLEQLLEVYERSVIEQSDRLYAEQERIRIQKTLLECQGEASPDGILSVGVDGAILFANRRFSEMWGVPRPAIGSGASELLMQALAEQTADPVAFLERAAVLRAGEEGHEEIHLADGRTFDAYTAPLLSEEGDDFGRVWTFHDVSTYKEVDRLKDEFVSAVSHELRTPLTSIRGSLGLMASGAMGKLPEEAGAVLAVALRSCERLVRLLNDVLDIEKIGAGRVDFHLEVQELEPLVVQSVEAMRPYAAQLGVGLRCEAFESGLTARIDPDRLLQVMQNLLSNAVKFSPEGSVVQVSLARRGPRARISVRDHGPGIPADFQGRIFEKFAQGGTRGARDASGTGLGLNISRAIVERLGGTIHFLSRPDAGTTFYFDLPAWSAEDDSR